MSFLSVNYVRSKPKLPWVSVSYFPADTNYWSKGERTVFTRFVVDNNLWKHEKLNLLLWTNSCTIMYPYVGKPYEQFV